ncbi:hypothetical protein HMPREF0201_01754 [Cedecea davisae DSM 4568]|uniref:Uncharacterized protein n=1 Tax=Cedecea davisae DSM 4568 TaxID=566551 RepID=S3JXM8_9ENTR|nr:hypothetical protein HMPREF0201_01754 [Cedecea davisae DSM 4568]
MKQEPLLYRLQISESGYYWQLQTRQKTAVVAVSAKFYLRQVLQNKIYYPTYKIVHH